MKKIFVRFVCFCIAKLHLEEKAEDAQPLPIVLVAHQIQRNIDVCRTESAIKATESMIDTLLLSRYPYSEARKYAVSLRWELFFKRIELGCNLYPKTTS